MAKDALIKLRVTAAEATAWKQAARASGLTLSEWARRRITGTITVELPPPPPVAMPTPKKPRPRRAPKRS